MTNRYTHSFLYYGQNEAAVQVKNLVLNGKSVGANTYNHPCLPPGYSTTFAASATRNVTLQGTGNYAACRVLTDSLMDTSARCLTDPNGDFSAHTTCSVGGTYQPPVNGNFVAFSGFTHVTDFLSLAANASLAQLQQAATASCKTPWTTLQANHPGVSPQKSHECCPFVASLRFLPSHCTVPPLHSAGAGAVPVRLLRHVGVHWITAADRLWLPCRLARGASCLGCRGHLVRLGLHDLGGQRAGVEV